jgi:hypothetical protein
MLVRLRQGVVGESRRTCHLVPVPDTDRMPDYLVAWCGERIAQGTADLLPVATGMPCESCLANAPASQGLFGPLGG